MNRAKEILDFFKELQSNNNREWFLKHKSEYESIRTNMLNITEELLQKTTLFDKTLALLTPQECLFRIYRDIRFSPDKTPYKTHFGTFLSTHGGRKSPFGGYYFHMEPSASVIAVGVFCPEPVVLKALRKSIIDNIDEWLEITTDPVFAAHYPTLFNEGKLKKIPVGFPKDFEYTDLLKYKHYTYFYNIPDNFFEREHWIDDIVNLFHIAYPLNKFLNFTIAETLNLKI